MPLCASISISVGSSLRSETFRSKNMHFFILIESAKIPSKKAVLICSTKKWQFPNPCQPYIKSIFFKLFFLSCYWGGCQLLFLICMSLVFYYVNCIHIYLLAICTSVNCLLLAAESYPPSNSLVEVLTPSISDVTIFGIRAFKAVIKVK